MPNNVSDTPMYVKNLIVVRGDDLPDGGGEAYSAVLQKVVQTEVVGTDIEEKASDYAVLFNESDAADGFIFFTDPHLASGETGYEAQMREYLKTLKTYYDATPTNFVVCGGDWLGNSDTIRKACFKLGYISGTMRSLVSPYYPIVGNHDTNYQGKSTVESTEFDGMLSNDTIRNLFVPGEEKTYYSFKTLNATYYVLDTGSDWDDTINEYRVEQLGWLADKLKADNAENSVIMMHIGYAHSGDSFVVAPFASNVLQMCAAFNAAESGTISGVSYNFSGKTGTVRYAMCGHVHADHNAVVSGIPLVAVTQMRDNGQPTFDLCCADYDKGTLNLVRVGNGENRVFVMA
jgi:hypothetical protein